MASENPNFAVTVNFANLDPWDPTKGGVNDPEPGAYNARTIRAVEYVKDDGGKSIKVTVALDGQGETDLYLGLDFSKEANKRKMLTALASIGLDAAKLKAAGDVKIEAKHFLGREGKGAPCFVIVKLVEGTNARGQKNLNDKEFATKEQYAAYKAMLASGNAPAARTTSNGATGGTTPAAGGQAPDAGLDNLFPS